MRRCPHRCPRALPTCLLMPDHLRNSRPLSDARRTDRQDNAIRQEIRSTRADAVSFAPHQGRGRGRRSSLSGRTMNTSPPTPAARSRAPGDVRFVPPEARTAFRLRSRGSPQHGWPKPPASSVAIRMPFCNRAPTLRPRRPPGTPRVARGRSQWQVSRSCEGCGEEATSAPSPASHRRRQWTRCETLQRPDGRQARRRAFSAP